MAEPSALTTPAPLECGFVPVSPDTGLEFVDKRNTVDFGIFVLRRKSQPFRSKTQSGVDGTNWRERMLFNTTKLYVWPAHQANHRRSVPVKPEVETLARRPALAGRTRNAAFAQPPDQASKLTQKAHLRECKDVVDR